MDIESPQCQLFTKTRQTYEKTGGYYGVAGHRTLVLGKSSFNGTSSLIVVSNILTWFFLCGNGLK